MFTGTSRKTDVEEKKCVFNGKHETVQIYFEVFSIRHT